MGRSKAEQLLIDFHKAKATAAEAVKERDRLKALVEAMPIGEYGRWEKAYGDARMVLDQNAVRDLCAQFGRPVPMVPTKAPLIVRPRS